MNHDHISVDDADKVSAESAWQTYSETHDSAGAMAVTDEECEAHSLSIASNPTLHRPAHMDIDFEKITTKKGRRDAAVWLYTCAVRRGWCYRPTNTE